MPVALREHFFWKSLPEGEISPLFVPDTGVLRQILMIAIITPWAFVGFESITHSAEEFRFPAGSLMGIFRAAIIVTTLLYAAVFLLSVSVYPDRYGSWTEYIGDLGNLQGIEGLPAFYAAYTCLGNTGIVILLLALLGLVFSSIIGNMTSLSRLFYALSGDRVLPARYKSLTRDGIPARALFLVFLLSLPVMFVGRTAVSWIVDVTTVGAIILYGFASAAALALARTKNDRQMILSGALGLGIMIVYGILTVIESLAGAGGLPRESQLIFIVWSVLGLLCFRVVMIRDHGKRFGRNLTVWVVLVGFIFFLSMLWILEECTAVTADNLVALRNYYHPGEPMVRLVDDIHMIPYQENLMKVFVFAILGVSGVFIVSLSALLSNWHYARKCEEETSRELGTMKNITYRDPLTGTGSKHAFVEAEENMDILIDQGNAGQFAVLVCDVNGLKHVNDTLIRRGMSTSGKAGSLFAACSGRAGFSGPGATSSWCFWKGRSFRIVRIFSRDLTVMWRQTSERERWLSRQDCLITNRGMTTASIRCLSGRIS